MKEHLLFIMILISFLLVIFIKARKVKMEVLNHIINQIHLSYKLLIQNVP